MIYVYNGPRFSSASVLRISSLCLVFFLSSCGEKKGNELKMPLRQVRSVVIHAGTGMHERSFSGRLYDSREASLSFKVSGTIQKIPVDVGDRVKKGDMIAMIDPSTYALEAQQSLATLAEAQAKLTNAKSTHLRIQNLYASGNVSRSELDNARSSFESAIAALEAAKKASEISTLNLSYTKLIASENCSIASVDAEEGENVAQGTQIFYTTSGEGLEVRLKIPEGVIANIKKEMAVDVVFSSIEGKVYKGKVSEVGVSSVRGGSTFPVTVSLTDSNSDGLNPGLSADVVFLISDHKKGIDSALIVPSFAIGEDQIGRFAFILEPTTEGHAIVKRKPVSVGNILQSGIEVLDGLMPGMRIVTAGISVLRDGMEVKYDDKK